MPEEFITQREADQRFSAIDKRFDAQDKFIKNEIEDVRETIKINRDADQRALSLQHTNYEEHLARLNGEASRIQNVLAQSVPREVFDNYKSEQQRWREDLTKQITDDREMRRRELASESEVRRRELSGEVRPLQNQASFDAGRNMGVIGLALTAGIAIGGLIISFLKG